MASISKHFYEITKDKTCHEIIHPWDPSCSSAALSMMLRSAPRILKFLFSFMFASTVYSVNNKMDLLNAIKIYFQMFLNGVLTIPIGIFISCTIFKMNKEYYKFMFILIPAMISAIMGLILPYRTRKIHTEIFFGIIAESFIKSSSIPFLIMTKNSILLKTIIFMCCSSLIMYGLKENKMNIFWFITPTNFNDKNNNISADVHLCKPSTYMDKLIKSDFHVCKHKNNCDKHILGGIKKYAKYGIGLEIIRRVASSFHMLHKSPLKFFKTIALKTDYNYLKFLVFYSGVYRLSNCYINRLLGEDLSVSSGIAGLLSGSAYWFSPSYYFLTSAFATAVQVFWELLQIKSNHEIKKSKKSALQIIGFLKKLPLDVICYITFTAVFAHLRLLNPTFLPSLGLKILDAITDNLSKDVHNRLKHIGIEKMLF